MNLGEKVELQLLILALYSSILHLYNNIFREYISVRKLLLFLLLFFSSSSVLHYFICILLGK